MRAAIATTLRDPGPGFESWLAYHFAIGFERVLVYFDDPGDPALEVVANHPGVLATLNDEHLHAQWAETTLWGSMPDGPRDLLDRQALNVDVALRVARQIGVDWLLHLDADELFLPPGLDAPRYFGRLFRQRVPYIQFPNHEALLREADADVTDPFRVLTTFKLNPVVWKGTPRAAEMDALVDEFAAAHGRGRWFYAYQSGKSAGKVSLSLIPHGVHQFRDAFLDADAPRDFVARDGACVLHYPNAGFQTFLRKFRMMNEPRNRFFERPEASSAFRRFYEDSCAAAAGGDEAAARKFYEENYLVGYSPELAALEDAGAVREFDGPARVLASLE